MAAEETHELELKRRITQLEQLLRISGLLSSTLDLNRLLQLIIDTAAQITGSEAASILLEDTRTGGLSFAAATGSSIEELQRIQVPIEGSLAGTIYKTGEPLIVGNASQDPRHFNGVDKSIAHQTRSLLGVPLRVRNRSIGVLEALNKRDNADFMPEDVLVLSTLASQAAIAIENARLVANLQEANRRLAKLDRLKSDFMSIASHELRTPLGLILGYASFLQEQVPGEMSKEVEMVLRGATQLQSLIETMTNLQYLESGGVQLERGRFVLQEMVRAVCAEWEPMISGKRQTLQQKMPPAPIYVEGDRAKLALVVSNLLNNAIKFTPPEGQIEITVRPQTGVMAISVSDTGIGIPPEELGLIFDPFYQVEDHLTRHHEGMGLGLSIAKGIVELHGGRIWAESVPGHGSRFTFTLPVRLNSGANSLLPRPNGR